MRIGALSILILLGLAILFATTASAGNINPSSVGGVNKSVERIISYTLRNCFEPRNQPTGTRAARCWSKVEGKQKALKGFTLTWLPYQVQEESFLGRNQPRQLVLPLVFEGYRLSMRMEKVYFVNKQGNIKGEGFIRIVINGYEAVDYDEKKWIGTLAPSSALQNSNFGRLENLPPKVKTGLAIMPGTLWVLARRLKYKN